jgi:hypothetical protein
MIPPNWEKEKEKRKGAEGSRTGIIGLACFNYLYVSLADRIHRNPRQKLKPSREENSSSGL